MNRSVRTLIGGGIGLAVAQLVLSTSQANGKSAGLIGAAFDLPSAWLRDLMDPSKPGIPKAKSASSSKSKHQDSGSGSSGSGSGGGWSFVNGIPLSATGPGTPAGTGSNIMSV